MKAKHIKKLREKIRDRGFAEKQLNKLADAHKYWNDFKQFECSVFFRGELKAEMNWKKYNKAMTMIRSKVVLYQSILNPLTKGTEK